MDALGVVVHGAVLNEVAGVRCSVDRPSIRVESDASGLKPRGAQQESLTYPIVFLGVLHSQVYERGFLLSREVSAHISQPNGRLAIAL